MDHLRRLFTPLKLAALCITILLFLLLRTPDSPGAVSYGTGPVDTLPVTGISEPVAAPAPELAPEPAIEVIPEKIPELKDVVQHKGMRIAILTFITRETSYTQLSLKNHQEYARKQGYDLIVDFEASNPQGLMWHKLDMMERTIAAGTADWMWWIDFDTLITNMTVKLSDIITQSLEEVGGGESVDLFVSKDCGPLNAGSMLLRSSPSSLALLARVREYGLANPRINEQDCLRDIIKANEHDEQNTTAFVPQRRINAYPEEIGCYDEEKLQWQEGDFVIHFAGAWAYLRDDKDSTGTLMRKYEHEVVTE